MEVNRTSYLFKNTAIFAIGNFSTKIISFFLIPLYTNILTTSEYGTIDLVVTIITVVVPIFTLNIMESVLRFSLDENADRKQITKIGIVILFFAMVISLLLIPLCNLFPEISNLGVTIYFYCVASSACQIFLSDLRGKEMLFQYSLGNVINTLLIALLNIVFLLELKMRVHGYLLAYIISNSLVALYALVVGKGYESIAEKFNINKAIEMLKYSIVLIPNSFMWWIINSSDHIMITKMIGIAENGIYSISYKIPTLITTFFGIFNQAWSYTAIREQKSDDISIYTNDVFRKMIVVIMSVGLCMLAFIKPFLRIYVSLDYFVSWKYTPFLIVGFVYSTLGTFMSTSYTVNKDSKGFLFSSMFGALFNITLNYILIPIIGVYGAALATCASYISIFCFRAIDTKKYMFYSIYTKEFIIGSILLLLSSFLMYINNITSCIIQIVMLLIYVALFNKTYIQLLRTIIKKFTK